MPKHQADSPLPIHLISFDTAPAPELEMTLEGSGLRDIARVLQVSSTTVIQEFKKLAHLNPVNQALLQQLRTEDVEVDIVRVEAPEETEDAGAEDLSVLEMWSLHKLIYI